MQAVLDRLERVYLRIDAWANRADNARGLRAAFMGATLASLILLAIVAAAPLLVVATLFAAAVLIVRAWHREFAFLMHLGDDAFPGRNDKAIWAVLLIVLPPVGLWLFRSHRLAMWPESEKPASVADELA